MTYLLILAVFLAVPGPAAIPAEATWADRSGERLPAACLTGNDNVASAVQERRSRFVDLIKTGTLDRFDDGRQEVTFKRAGAARGAHEPGPLEDEAVASAARGAIAADYARFKLKPRVTCIAGKVTLASLPNDPAMAAGVLDTLLTLDGVQTVSASLPACLRMP